MYYLLQKLIKTIATTILKLTSFGKHTAREQWGVNTSFPAFCMLKVFLKINQYSKLIIILFLGFVSEQK